MAQSLVVLSNIAKWICVSIIKMRTRELNLLTSYSKKLQHTRYELKIDRTTTLFGRRLSLGLDFLD